jgi:hypothetical protein
MIYAYDFFNIQDGDTPLLYAACKNNLDMVKVLLDAKAEVNVQSKVYQKVMEYNNTTNSNTFEHSTYIQMNKRSTIAKTKCLTFHLFFRFIAMQLLFGFTIHIYFMVISTLLTSRLYIYVCIYFKI